MPGPLLQIPSRLRRDALWVGVFLVGLCLGLCAAFALERRETAEHVLRGIVLVQPDAELPLAGLSRRALRDTLTEQRTALVARPMTLWIGEQRFDSTAGELGVDVDVEDLKRRALELGREGAAPRQLLWWLGRLFTKARLRLEPRIDAQRFDAKLTQWQQTALPHRPPEPSVEYVGVLRARYPEASHAVDTAGARELLRSWLTLAPASSEPLLVPLRTYEPRVTRAEVDARLAEAQSLLAGPVLLETEDRMHRVELTPAALGQALECTTRDSRLELSLSPDKLQTALAEVRAALEKPAVSATFEVDAKRRVTVVPSQPGVLLDEAAVAREALLAAARPERRGALPLLEEPPAFTTAQAEGLNVRGLVSQFTTRHACCEARVKNIHFAASQVDGVLLRPGERLSLNELLGPRTNESGFLDAPTIVRGKMKESPGGGISQFATTLFNAVFDGGYEVVQRQPHSYYFSRYPEGHEATVSYPEPDLIFRNDTAFGLLIKTEYSPTFIRVLLYGDNEGRQVERRVSRRFDLVEPPIDYEPNESLEPEESKQTYKGQTGWSILATRIIRYADGRSVEQRRRVIYKPRPQVVEVHPCKIPKGRKGHTGERCPEPEPEDEPEDDGELEAAEADGELLESPPPLAAANDPGSSSSPTGPSNPVAE